MFFLVESKRWSDERRLNDHGYLCLEEVTILGASLPTFGSSLKIAVLIVCVLCFYESTCDLMAAVCF